jgi:peptide/nickel transport system ATP-binding protein
VVEEALPEHVLRVEDLTKVFKLRSGIGRSTDFTAVDNVSLSIKRGTTTAIVGESGSGKSTVAQMVLNLLKPTLGRIIFDGVDTSTLNAKPAFCLPAPRPTDFPGSVRLTRPDVQRLQDHRGAPADAQGR